MKRFIIIILAFVTISIGCEKFARHSYGIRIQNNSNYNINFYGKYILPDTTLSSQKPILRTIAPGDSEHLYDQEVDDLGLVRFDTEKLTIFILKKDTVDNNSWDDIRDQYKVLKRYEIDENDLIELGGSVIFP